MRIRSLSFVLGVVTTAVGCASATHGDDGPTATSELVSGSKRALVVLYNFSNDTRQPATPAAIKAAIGGTSGATVNTYYGETSYGNMTIAATVTPWITLGAANTGCGTDGTHPWLSEAAQKARALGFDPSQYDFVVYTNPTVSGSCSQAYEGYDPAIGSPSGSFIEVATGAPPCTLGVLGCSVTTEFGSAFGTTMALLFPTSGSDPLLGYKTTVSHEVGHSLGNAHSSSITCTNGAGLAVPYSGTCTHHEYGDPYSVMGTGWEQLNVVDRARLGWSTTTRVTAAGSYRIAPLEVRTTAPQGLVIPRPDGKWWSVEARQPGGQFDQASEFTSAGNGVLLRIVGDPSDPQFCQCTGAGEIIDMTPSTSTLSDAELTVGQTFTDSTVSPPISITLKARDTTGATVAVAF